MRKIIKNAHNKYFIGCNKWNNAESHKYLRIPLGVNINYLKELFQNYNFSTDDIEVCRLNLLLIIITIINLNIFILEFNSKYST